MQQNVGTVELREGASGVVLSPARLPVSSVWQQVLLVAVFFAATAPMLSWADFTNGMEAVSVATGMETWREGHWLMPTLHGQPRWKKPPVAHWLSAVGLGVSGSLEFGVRWPTLVCACVLLLSVYHLGRILGGRELALASAVICATSYLFLRYSRQASYDTPLAMWVGLANVCLAMAVFEGRWWTGCIGAGAALGMAMLTKGPVSLLQTVVPVAAFAAMERFSSRSAVADAVPGRTKAWAVITGVGVLLAVAGPWYLYMFQQIRGLGDLWLGQVTLREEIASEQRGAWYAYLQFIPMMAPWAVWMVVGAVALFVENPYSQNRRIRLALLLIVVPLVIMSFFWKKHSRYTVPMIGPGSVLAAWGVMVHLPGWMKRKAVDRGLVMVHWGGLAVAVAGLALAGAMGWGELKTAAGRPWYSPAMAGALAIVGVGGVVAFASGYRRRAGALVLGTGLLMLLFNGFFQWGYSQGEGRRATRAVAAQILASYPDAEFYGWHPQQKDPPMEMAIYLNRTIHKVRDMRDIPTGGKRRLLFSPVERVPGLPAGARLAMRRQTADADDSWYLFELPGVSERPTDSGDAGTG